MNACEVRAVVRAYYHIQNLLDADTQGHLGAFLQWAESACWEATEASGPSRWARDIVGPVLAAGLGAASYAREVTNPGGMLRIFGLIGDHALPSLSAWGIMQPYCLNHVVCEEALANIRRQTGLRLNKLPADPSPLDLLEELTRPRSSELCTQVAHWIAEYFRDHALDDTLYSETYRSSLAGLDGLNERGEMAQLVGLPSIMHGKFTRKEWAEIICGRVPRARVEMRAGYLTTRKFLIEYWERWNTHKSETAFPVISTGCGV
jgi:hypothetical protein